MICGVSEPNTSERPKKNACDLIRSVVVVMMRRRRRRRSRSAVSTGHADACCFAPGYLRRLITAIVRGVAGKLLLTQTQVLSDAAAEDSQSIMTRSRWDEPYFCSIKAVPSHRHTHTHTMVLAAATTMCCYLIHTYVRMYRRQHTHTKALKKRRRRTWHRTIGGFGLFCSMLSL